MPHSTPSPRQLQSSRTCPNRSSKPVGPQSCRPAVRRKHIHLSGASPSGEASNLGQIADASGIEFLDFSDYGHYVSGPTGTGKTHLATGLAVEACRQRKRVRFTTAAELVNELMEAKSRSELSRVRNRWLRYQLIVIDEMAYVGVPELAAELLFQVISGRAEQASVIVTTNLPFSEWNTMFANARLCKAMLDRLTDQAHIIDTGKESYRFRRSLDKKKGGNG